jgi:thiol-disulfide isomerase/thioredoxin
MIYPFRRSIPKRLLGLWLVLALTASVQAVKAQQPVQVDIAAPELSGGPWLNTAQNVPIKLASRKGNVTIVEFWTYGCINCRRNLPSYGRWQKRFAGKGVAIIGVHTPETEGEKVQANIVRHVKQFGITYPVLLDLKGVNWRRWGQQFWPTVYLIDKKGYVRYRWEGELEYENAGGEEKMARLVEELLREKV